MIDLDIVAQTFVDTFRTDEVAADKEATARLLELADNDEAVYLSLRNDLAKKIQFLLEQDLMANASEARLQAEGVLDEEGFVTENETPVEEPPVENTDEKAEEVTEDVSEEQ